MTVPPIFAGPIRVAIHDDWGDLPDALRLLTPGGGGVWDGVAFAPAAEMPEPDFVLVLNRPAVDGVAVTCPPERLWFAPGEPPTDYHRPLHLGQGAGTLVLTCDPHLARAPPAGCPRQFVFELAMLRTWSVRRSIDELRTMPPPEKTANLSWVTSDRAMLPGHRLRLSVLATLREHGIPFDLYGRGFHPIADKWNGLAPYRYSIAFENSPAPAYFSEKIMDCFVTMTMPIFFGSPEISRFFPSGSYVRLEPTAPGLLDQIREIAESDRWERSQDALLSARRLVIERYNLFARLARAMRRRMAPPSPPRTFVLRRPDLRTPSISRAPS